jgi:acyl dehydratase
MPYSEIIAPVLSIDAYCALVGQDLGVSEWILVDQARINAFADCTGDHQFIHVNEQRAKQTPFGGTIAHGLLTLSLLPAMAYDVLPKIQGATHGVNYGYDKVRFVSPVPSGSQVRGHFKLESAEITKPGVLAVLIGVSVEIAGQAKPALVAGWRTMQYFQAE